MLISEDYRKEQHILHQNPDYGVASIGFAPLVTKLIDKLGVVDLLDYGAGKGRLAQTMLKECPPDHKLDIAQYDPGYPDFDVEPSPAEMVACIDVLEHIEPDCLDEVLDHLQRLTMRIGLFTIHTKAAIKMLSDGRNAHLIQQPYSWWLPKLWDRFTILTFQEVPDGFYVVVKNGTH